MTNKSFTVLGFYDNNVIFQITAQISILLCEKN